MPVTNNLGIFSKLRTPNEMREYLYRRLHAIWRQGVRLFVTETIKRIHVDTGMSAASLIPLAYKLDITHRITESLRGFGPRRRGPGKKKLTGFFTSNNVPWKTWSAGMRLGEKAYQLKYGSPRNTIFYFSFDIVVFQWYLWENGLAHNNEGQVWGAVDAGHEAMIEYINTECGNITGLEILNFAFGKLSLPQVENVNG